MQNFFQQLRYTLRLLRKAPVPTLTIVFTLAIGIGANTALFTVDYAVLLAPLPYPHPEQLVMEWSRPQGQGRNFVSPADFADWKRQSTVFQDLNAWRRGDFNIAMPDRPEHVQGIVATPGYNQMFGNSLLLGRNFLPEEGDPGKNHVVILTNRLWQRLGADRGIAGRPMRIDGEPYRVIGVLAPGVPDRWDQELIVPLTFKPEELKHVSGGSGVVVVGGRLKAGVTIQQAQADADLVAGQIAKDYPNTNRGLGAVVEPVKNDFLPRDRQLTLWLMLGAVGLLLLLACLNIAKLLLAQGIARQKEIAIRSALGSGGLGIFAQSLTESLALAIVGGILGIILGNGVLKAIIAMMPPGTLPFEAEVQLNFPVLATMFGASAIVGLLFGCAPAWYAAHMDPLNILKSGGRTGGDASAPRLRRLLVITEFALALPILVATGLLVRSLWSLSHVDLGVRTDHVLGFYLDSSAFPRNRAQINEYYRRILSSIAAVPGVTSVAAFNHLPLDHLYATMPFTIAGQSAEPSSRPTADIQTPTPDYFQTFGIRIIRGRAFTKADTENSPKIAMINEAFANSYLKNLDPLNQRLIMDQWMGGDSAPAPGVQWQIVGVFHTVKSRGAREDFPQIAVPFWQMGPDIAGIGVRTGPLPGAMIGSITAAVTAVDSQATFVLTRTMDQIRGEAWADDRFTSVLFASFAIVALLLAAGGIYGLTAFSVAQRSHEIALRMALGATHHRVIVLVVKEGMALAGIGSIVGLAGAYFIARMIRSLLFGVPSVDYATFAIAELGLLLPALAACYFPALSAKSIEIMETLKRE